MHYESRQVPFPVASCVQPFLARPLEPSCADARPGQAHPTMPLQRRREKKCPADAPVGGNSARATIGLEEIEATFAPWVKQAPRQASDGTALTSADRVALQKLNTHLLANPQDTWAQRRGGGTMPCYVFRPLWQYFLMYGHSHDQESQSCTFGLQLYVDGGESHPL